MEFITIKNGLTEVTFLDQGATIVNLKYQGKDTVIGFDTKEEYVFTGDYLGATIGRNANRIEGGKFILNGKEYKLAINNGNNNHHGGLVGFDRKIFGYEVKDNVITFSYLSKDMEEGFPGNLELKVIYTVLEDGLEMEYVATSDKDTVCNITNHTYFNLDLENIENTYLKINSDSFLAINEDGIPTHIESVDGSPFDFREYKKIGRDINIDNIQLKNAGGYDQAYILNDKHEMTEACSFYTDKSDFIVTVYTTQRAIHFYSGNFLSGCRGKNGFINGPRMAFALEPSNYPNVINSDPTQFLRKGEIYNHKISYKFSPKK